MKIQHLIVAIGIGTIIACGDNASKKEEKENSPYEAKDTGTTYVWKGNYCFRAISGAQMKDSLSVSLVIDSNAVTGQYSHSIFEKDARRGSLTGNIEGDKIKAVWTFMQEGLTDTMQLEFQIEDSALFQRPLVVNEVSGREQTNTNATYTIKIPKSPCQ